MLAEKGSRFQKEAGKSGLVCGLTICHRGQFQDHMEGAFNVGEIICDAQNNRVRCLFLWL